MGASYTVASAFIINNYHGTDLNLHKRMGNSYIYVGDDATTFSTSLTLATTEPINEGGFINFDKPVKGRYVVLRRIGPPAIGNWDYSVSEIRIYAVTNLLHYGASILKAPDPLSPAKSADNLITNLRTRSARNDV